MEGIKTKQRPSDDGDKSERILGDLNPRSKAIVDQYRNILNKMTSDLVRNWHIRFVNSNGEGDGNLARFLHEFDNFSQAYFDYIITKMPPSVRDNPRFVRRDLRRVLDNLQRNWGELLAVCNQRENENLSEALCNADKEARAYYDRYRGRKATLEDGAHVMPLTYFGHRYEITRYLYTPFPLLSFRFEALGSPRLRRNGLAHELGHFIFWNAPPDDVNSPPRETGRRIDQLIATIIGSGSWPCSKTEAKDLAFNWMNWKTEVFADIVGALLTGTHFFDSSLILFVDEQYSDEVALLPQDRTHPYPILRPLIAVETLEWLAKNQPGVLNETSKARVGELRKEWEERFEAALNSQKKQANMFSDELKTLAKDSNERQEKEANKKTLEKRICKVRNAVAQTSPIVEMLLTEELWLDKDGQPCSLSELFTFEEENEVNEGVAGESEKRGESAKSRSFESMSTFVKGLINNPGNNEEERSLEMQEEAAYRALIELPLGEENGWTGCRSVTHVGPGKGNYNYVANTCGPLSYLVRDDGYPNGEYV